MPRLSHLLTALTLIVLALSAAAAPATRTVLVLGDSLSAGYGIRQEAAWPALLDKRLQAQRTNLTVVNASISGETSSGGRSRLPALLARYSPGIVIVALGSNDGLRGLPIATLRENLAATVDAALKARAKVLLIGQRLPPNFGPYAEEFRKTFGAIARTRHGAHVAYVDFLLTAVATRPDYFQADGLHPTAEAQPLILETVWQGLAPLLQ